MDSAFDTTSRTTGGSKIGAAIWVFTRVLLFAVIVGVPFWLVFGIAFYKVLVVALLLGMLIPTLMLVGEEIVEDERRSYEQARKATRGDAEREERQRQQARLREAEQERIKRRRISELRAMPYKEYLRTPHWQRLRKGKLRMADYRCQLCNSDSGPLEVHHNTYERRGQELDRDLIVLCRVCHSRFHDIPGL